MLGSGLGRRRGRGGHWGWDGRASGHLSGWAPHYAAHPGPACGLGAGRGVRVGQGCTVLTHRLLGGVWKKGRNLLAYKTEVVWRVFLL